jgi:hypothetical protein
VVPQNLEMKILWALMLYLPVIGLMAWLDGTGHPLRQKWEVAALSGIGMLLAISGGQMIEKWRIGRKSDR